MDDTWSNRKSHDSMCNGFSPFCLLSFLKLTGVPPSFPTYRVNFCTKSFHFAGGPTKTVQDCQEIDFPPPWISFMKLVQTKKRILYNQTIVLRLYFYVL